MPRSLVLGNGNMLATFDNTLQMRDFYFPYVGMEDHTQYNHKHRIGVFIEGIGIQWLDDKNWETTITYSNETLLGKSTAKNSKLGITLHCKDFVHPIYNTLIRSFMIESDREEMREVKMYFEHDFHIYGDKQKDTAFYEPHSNTVIHYREKRYFLVGGQSSAPSICRNPLEKKKFNSILKNLQSSKSCGISEYTVGKIGYKGLEGTWKDAEDGHLHDHPVEQGSVDSTIGIYSNVSKSKPVTVEVWICAGKNLNDVLKQHNAVIEETPEKMERNCHNYWRSWVNKSELKFGSLDQKYIDLYKRSLLITRLFCDNNGGIIAAADSDIMEFNKDTYTYIWPRDGAFISIALDKAGYHEVTKRFFEFCNRVQMPDGYLLHKYNPDESLGSSWHPWFKNGQPQLPIQEDETALIIYAIYKHFEISQDFEFLQKMYEEFLKGAAEFLVNFTEQETGLPLPSYDLWEEQRGIFTYTTACTIAGLDAAAKISHILGHFTHSEKYQHAADQMRQAMLFHLYHEKEARFVKKIVRENGITIESDSNADSSICAIWKLGVLDVNDQRVKSTMRQLEEKLTIHTSIGGLARYQNDYYHAVVPNSPEITGNPWIITTLWLAQWKIATANTIEELESSKKILDWVLAQATSSGILPEQINPINGNHLSVSPLTWSHATYIETILLYVAKEKEIIKK